MDQVRQSKEAVEIEYSMEIAGNTEHFAGRLMPFEDDSYLAIIRGDTERARMEEELRYEMALQNLLMTIASDHINIRPDQVDSAIDNALGELARFVHADRSYIFDYDWERRVCDNSYEWCAPGISPQKDQLQDVPLGEISLWVETHKRGDTMYVPDVFALAQGDPLRTILEPQDIKSLITIPIMEEGICAGFVGFDSVLSRHRYSERERILLSVFAQILVSIRTRARLERRIVEESEKARAANLAKSGFLASMSHEIRTPLNAIIGFSDLLARSGLEGTQLQYATSVVTASQSLLGIIDDILDFSKIEAGKLELEEIPVDLEDLAGQCMDIVSFQVERKGLELVLDLDPDMPRSIIADPVRLKQILVNFLSNAVKFTDSGEVELRIDFEALRDGHGSFTFSVRDTGIGMDASHKERIFQAFAQAETSTTRKYGGTGLGLSISRLLAARMGSSIHVETAPGAGSRFSFTLIRDCAGSDALITTCQEPSSAGNLARSVRSVLIVDDNAHTRAALRRQISGHGIPCQEAESGLAALAFLGQHGLVGLVIIDQRMPDMDGLQTVAAIREGLRLSPGVQPVILLHGAADTAEVAEAAGRLGLLGTLLKPPKPRDLARFLDTLPTEEKTSMLPIPPQSSAHGTPETPDAVSAAPPPAPGAPAAGTVPRILVAEDVPMNMMLVRAILRKLMPKVEILEAEDGGGAMRLYLERQPDMVLLDVQMPVLDGPEASRRIRQIESASGMHVPIYALTAGATPEEEERCRNAGMDGFLTKPLNVAVLRDILTTHFPSPIGAI
jgi:signal transduction histidine kinase/CheY-like chemotaxis protein